jgi:fimbrial chaperone protein
VELGSAHRTEFFTIHNDDDAPVVIQVRTVAWSQEAGEEQFRDTPELLSTPPVFQVAPKGEQIVRVALRRPVDPTRELAYRLFFQEVPPASGPTLNGLNVALRLSVPVFVQPARAASADLVWELHPLPQGSMQIDVSNRGTAHQQVTDFDVLFGAAPAAHVALSRYVLPGGHATWTVGAPAGATGQAKVAVHGYSDAGEFSAEVVRSGGS